MNPPSPNSRVPRVLDIECISNYFLIMVRNVYGPIKIWEFEMYPGGPPIDTSALSGLLANSTIITYNGTTYDVPMIGACLAGYNCQQLRDISDQIIVGHMPPWTVERQYRAYVPEWIDHIDLINSSPGVKIRLKVYGGRLHSKRIQDLPFDHRLPVAPEDRATMRVYCGNDLQTTIDLYLAILPDIALREEMGAEYDVDLRSKSDAQIAGEVFKKMIGYKVTPKLVAPGTTFKTSVPPYVQFLTPTGESLLQRIRDAVFRVSPANKVVMPKTLEGFVVHYGTLSYKMGIGGLHSREKSVWYKADDEYELNMIDATSFYPYIMLKNRMFPTAIGERWLDILQTLVDIRVTAKREKKKRRAGSYKIVVNGTFGHTSNRFSIMFEPELLILTTLTGQLTLLMLIEMLALAGFQVVSANTDGIVVRNRRSQRHLVERIVSAWTRRTSFAMEWESVSALYCRDVNNYMAFHLEADEDGSWYKGKGDYAETSLRKTPDRAISVKAVAEYLRCGTPIAQTIRACTDIREFVVVRAADGGGVYAGQLVHTTAYSEEVGRDVRVFDHIDGGEYLGGVVRWYYATAVQGAINDKKTGNIVAGSDGGKPCMVLPDKFPDDVDFAKYEREAHDILIALGVAK